MHLCQWTATTIQEDASLASPPNVCEAAAPPPRGAATSSFSGCAWSRGAPVLALMLTHEQTNGPNGSGASGAQSHRQTHTRSGRISLVAPHKRVRASVRASPCVSARACECACACVQCAHTQHNVHGRRTKSNKKHLLVRSRTQRAASIGRRRSTGNCNCKANARATHWTPST